VEFGLEKAWNRDCHSKHHPWLLEFSSARGYLELKQSSYSPSTSSYCCCFKESSFKNNKNHTAIPGFEFFRIARFCELLDAFCRALIVEHGDSFSLANDEP
jgi:hypothetical protein